MQNKHQPLYREVLKKSWQLTKKHKHLWLFGFFATFLQTSGVFEVLWRAFGRIEATGWQLEGLIQTAYPGAPVIGTFALLGNSESGITPGGFIVILVLLAIFIGLLWFVASAEGALLFSTKGTGRTVPKIEKAFAEGRKYGWYIVLFHVAQKLLIAFFFLLTSLPLLLASVETTAAHVLLYFVAFLIFFPLALIVSFITIYAICGVVIARHGFAEALHEAWQLFAKHWIISLETALILFGVSLLGTLAVGIFAVIIGIPFLLLLFAGFVTGSSVFLSIIFTLFIIIVGALALFVGSIITTFQLATWSQLYVRLRKHGGVPKVVQFLRGIPKFFLHRT